MTDIDGTADRVTSVWSALRDDLRCYARLRIGGRSASHVPIVTAFVSPGWWQLVMHRVAHRSVARRQHAGGKWRERLLFAGTWPFAIALKVLTKNELLESTHVESGVWLSNRGGIVLGARRIGRGAVIHHNVTIGMNVANGGMPVIGRAVWVGHDSVIHGEITIGDGATILPGSILTKTIPAGAVVHGNPACVVIREYDNAVLRASADVDPELPMMRPAPHAPPRAAFAAAGAHDL